MLSAVGITQFYGTGRGVSGCRIKQEVEDFAVQEVVNGKVCQVAPLIDLERFRQAERLLENLPQNLDKEERKEVYSIANYHPFRRLVTKSGQFLVEDSTSDVFVFTVMKYNYSANSMQTLLARRLSVHENCIQTNGTKDKRAVTFQEVSAKCTFERLFSYAVALEKAGSAGPADCVKCRDIARCTEYGFDPRFDCENQAVVEEISRHMEIHSLDVTEAIRIFDIRRGNARHMGDLDGNRFTIKLRGIDCMINAPRMFINYYGQQRFGVHLTNHIVGEHILERRYDEALKLIMEEPLESDTPSVSSPHPHSRVQKHILKMKRDGYSSKSIINSLSRGARMIYLHAFQSYKFNLAVNELLGAGEVLKARMVERDGVLTSASPSDSIDDVFLPLEKMDDKLLKGGFRKVVETVDGFECWSFEGGITARFFLKKSCYATMALREMVGDYACS